LVEEEIEIGRLLLLFVPCWLLHALHLVESRCACMLLVSVYMRIMVSDLQLYPFQSKLSLGLHEHL
jgi:hypothetical protein